MSEILERPNAQAVAADLRVGSSDTQNDPDEWRQQALRDAKPTALALNVPPVPPVRPRSDRNGMAVPTPNAAAPRTTDAAPADPNDPWQSSPMMVSLKGILIPGEGAGGDPTARNPISGARGTFQFMHDTFVPLMKKNHPEETRGKSDAEIWAMADNPNTNSREAAELAHDNMIQMQKAGVQITPQTLAGAHRLGAGGIIAVLKADPNTPISAIVPAAFSQGGNMDIHDLTAAQFLAKPYPGGGGGGNPLDQQASYQRIQQSFQQAQEAMREITQDYRKDRDRVRDLASRYKPFEPTPAPRPPEVDPLQSFGGIASIFVALAAGLSKTPAVAAMNGLAGMIDGAREKDWTSYAANYKAWKDNSEYAYKAHEQYSNDIKDAVDMMSKDVSLGEAMMKATLAIGGDYEKQMQEWRMRPEEFLLKQAEAEKARIMLQERQQAMEEDRQLTALNGNRDMAREQLTAAQATNDPVKVAEAQKHLTDAEAEVERKLTDIERRKAAQAGYHSRGGTGAGSNTAQAVALRRFMEQKKQETGREATAEEIQDFIIRFKEEAPDVAARHERDQDRKDRDQDEKQRANREKERQATEKYREAERVRSGSVNAERAARFEQVKANLPPGTPDAAVWDAVDRQMLLAKSPGISDAAARNVAEQVLAGNMGALSGFGRNPSMLAQIENKIAEVAAEKGLTGADIVRAKADFGAYTSSLRAFATGKQGQQAQSFNVATQHLALLSQAAETLANEGSQGVNRFVNAFKNQFGWEEPITFNAIKTIVGSEIEKAVTGSQGALQDREELRSGLTPDATPEQLASVIKGYKGLMAGQLQGLEKTYERTTKRTDFRDEFLLPEAKEELNKLAPPSSTARPPTDAAHPPVPAPLTGKPGLAWSETRKQWRDSNGKIYNQNGAEVR